MKRKCFVLLSMLLMLSGNTMAFGYVDYNANNWPGLMPILPQVTNPETIQFSQSKGIGFYKEFPDVPNFLAFAKMPGALGVEYVVNLDEFYYLENPSAPFVYKSQLYDYIHVAPGKMASYKNYLKLLDFEEISTAKKFDNVNFNDYYDTIQMELKLDPDFKLGANSIYFKGNDSEFIVVLIGDSVVTVNDPLVNTNVVPAKTIPCNEIRMYSLKMTSEQSMSLMSTVDLFDIQGILQKELINAEPEINELIVGGVPDPRIYTPPSELGWLVNEPLASPSFYESPAQGGIVVNQPLANASVYTKPVESGGVSVAPNLPNAEVYASPQTAPDFNTDGSFNTTSYSDYLTNYMANEVNQKTGK